MLIGWSLFEIEDLSNLEHSLNTMIGIFCYCGSLKFIYLSNLKTSTLVDMYWMFFEYNPLKSTHQSNFNTSSVQNMILMFSDFK